ncbi:MAG: FkbM family methyltransferase [Sulfuricella sp.]|nr:FkbM family methyltransferase [Sulfuricella sp.]
MNPIKQFIEIAGGLARWPKFSLTSFTMVSGLRAQGLMPETVIDVGANVGQFAVASAKFFPKSRIYSFEPNPPCARQLKKNVAGLGNVTTYELALGEEEGEVEFHVNSHSHSSSILPLAPSHLQAFPDAREHSRIRVEVSTLDRIFGDIDLQRPALLKLDVQGYELQVLQGGSGLLTRVDYVLLEASFRPMYQGEPVFMDIEKKMREFGFQFLRPVGFLRAPDTGEFLQMDALFQRRPE